jgi:hypothetical protein
MNINKLTKFAIGLSLIAGSANAATVLAIEDFETPDDFGVWTNTAGNALYYNFAETDQPSGDLTTNFSAPGGEGAVDLRKSGGTITSPALTLDTYNSPDLTINLDYTIFNGSSTRRAYWQISVDGGSNWFGLGLTQTGGGVSNLISSGASVTITEGVSGVSLGGTLKSGNASGVSTYDGSAFSDNTLIRFTNGGSAGADLRQFYDNIEVTSTVVVIPEPSSTALLGLGGLALILRKRR